jgi:serine/threonine-protein kinase RsbW
MSLTETRHVHLILTSRYENIEIAERALVDLCNRTECAEDQRYWLVTALREAAANAIRHGNQQDPEQLVRIDLSVDDRDVSIRIEDEGEGFDFDAIPDPTDPENLLRPSGRGIFYMRQFMNRVEFDRTPGGGTVVEMVGNLQPTTRSSADEE